MRATTTDQGEPAVGITGNSDLCQVSDDGQGDPMNTLTPPSTAAQNPIQLEPIELNNGVLDKQSCAARLAAGVLKNTGVTPTNLQYTGTNGGHANYSFDVSDLTVFKSILSKNPPFSLPLGIDKGYRYGVIQSTHVENTLTGGFSGHTDIFSGHSIVAPLHLLVDVGIGHIPGVNLDFGCKEGS